ncbi:MAG: T9SS type A sorting domain-containing protein, partial [bacterium]|nr:T9SS type A sorting domain-containing protein [bacterium]
GGAASNFGHEVEYQFDWGDGNTSAWGNSSRSYSYGSAGTYQVRARARCQTHTSIVSGWSSSREVIISSTSETYTLTILVDPIGAGSVTINPNKSSYEYNEPVQLTAVANSGFTFDFWSGDIPHYTYSSITIYMQRNRVITANFTAVGETVSIPDTPAGPDYGAIGQNLQYTTGGSVSNLGHQVEYQFYWGDGTTSFWGSNGREHTFITSGVKQITARARSEADTSIVSNWSEPLSVTINGLILAVSTEPDTGGTVDYEPIKAEYSLGDTVTLWANPASGFSFEQWTGSISGSLNPIQLVMNSNKSVTAVFNRTMETVSRPAYLNGPETGIMGQSLSFSTGGSVSNLGHLLEYQFSWGDGQMSAWGEDTQEHAYSYAGSYQIKSRARCKTHPGVISEWSEPHAITITGYFLMEFITPSGTGTIERVPNKTFFAVGERVVVSAVPLLGYKFERWSGDLVSTSNPDTVIMNGNTVITAHFSEASEIVSTPTIIQGPDTSIIEQEVTFITGGSTSSKGNQIEYQFHWGDGTLSGWGDSVRTYIYNSAGAKEVKARARSRSDSSVVSNWTQAHTLLLLNNYFTISLSVNPINSGSVNRTPFKAEYKDGEMVILSPLPANGYVFDYWGGDLSGIDNPAIIFIHSNKNIIAHFKQYSGIDKERDKLPEKFVLDQNYPNPFNPETTINYQLAEEGHVKITVFNMHGQIVSTLVDQHQSAGYYSIVWRASEQSGSTLPSGVYLYQIENEHFKQLRKMILLK